MPTKKLTDRVRAKIKGEYRKLKESDYSGEALTYLRRVRGAAKSRKIKEDTTLYIGKFKVPKNSNLYEKIAGSAKMKNKTIKQFLKNKNNAKAVMMLARDGGVTVSRESEYLMEDIKKLPKGRKVFWNGIEVTRVYAISLLMEIQSSSAQLSNIVMIRYRVRYDLLGNLYISYVPSREEIDEALEEVDDFDSDEEREQFWLEFIDKYKNIDYVKS